MNTRFIVPFQIFLFFAYSSVTAQESSKNDAIQFKKVFSELTNDWLKAYNSNDAHNLIPLYTVDAVYISSHVNGLEIDGRTNVIEYFQKGIDGGGHIDKIEILSISLSCDLATLICKYQATNRGITVSGRNLLVMKKINAKWLIVAHMTVV